ncbi:AAA family ATPase [Pseudomonas sp. R2-60-08W]|uniref:AAA family ATPase n=1 Tax=Pseudomonas sp. R2-60-08W TaxID=1173280 RepID=UPI000F56DCA6|nr:AAA family ATPase [Pseudomonas sp. R2-60-08W]AZF25692.1 Putative ATP binding protein SugR [Pseudomonas sp. R2-60-08W]
MKIKQIHINCVGGIDDLDLIFDDHMNIISGPNGIGKTTILESVAQAFAGYESNLLKRMVSSECGTVTTYVDSGNGQIEKQTYNISQFSPRKNENTQPFEHYIKHLISLKVARTFTYVALDAVSRDADRNPYNTSNSNKNGVNLTEVKSWFVNRYLYSAHPGALTDIRMHNFERAKTFFSLLNSEYRFSRVDAGTNEIMVNTPTGEIYYEYLSSGFKSCLSILFGIVKEIEFRFAESDIKLDEFEGVILIDELELHLHPEWQAKISTILAQAFPNAQFITTTHSPHIIQAAMPNQVVALHHTNGKIQRKSLPSSEYGYQGWTVEEVLTDVMGLGDTRTDVYQDAIQSFQRAVDEDNYKGGILAFEKLEKLLHPENNLRKLLSFQLGAIKG